MFRWLWQPEIKIKNSSSMRIFIKIVTNDHTNGFTFLNITWSQSHLFVLFLDMDASGKTSKRTLIWNVQKHITPGYTFLKSLSRLTAYHRWKTSISLDRLISHHFFRIIAFLLLYPGIFPAIMYELIINLALLEE